MTTLPENLLINLEILSNIQKNGRITRSYNGKIHLENDNILQGIKRYVTNDSRFQSINEINSIVKECFNVMDHIVNSKYMCSSYPTEFAQNCDNLEFLANELETAYTGIDNLKFTYQDDKNTESELNVILRKITAKIKDIRYKVSYFRNNFQWNSKTNNELIA